jgi:putative redox protein
MPNAQGVIALGARLRAIRQQALPQQPLSRPPTIVDLEWESDLRLQATAGENRLILDSNGTAGVSPMQALALALAGCMAMDVIHIVRKGRHDLRGLRVRLTGQRAPDEPRRFIAIVLHFTVSGAVSTDQVQRAIDLSREKYCSVWSSMRQDISLEVTHEITGG